ncbi:DUF1028 domain-containing protein [Candidatus Thorarchaeota archaeon]|nr:MAG: DUF1028 domain-containing protein [Candidatus Thorarchaeota archaeon]
MTEVSLPRPSTFSVLARDPENGDLGVIVQSKFPAVGSLVPWARAGIGAIATQAWANVSYGPRGLDFLKGGMTASEVLDVLLASDDGREHRQVAIVDSEGNVAAHTGDECMDWAGHVVGDNFACQGNILAGPDVIEAMSNAFESQSGDLVDRLFAALKAGQSRGGDRRGMQSAAILVVREGGGYEGGTDRYVDVRVDDHPRPIEELERIFAIYDMTLLNREDPSNLLTIEGDLASQVTRALVELGYLSSSTSEGFDQDAQNALQKYININNFENKMREDGKIWKSVLDYLVEDAGLA